MKVISSTSKQQEIIETLHAQAFLAFEEGDFKKAIGLWKKGIKKCKKLNDPELLGKLYLGVGMGHAQENEYTEALVNFQKALELYKQFNPLKHAQSLYFIGKMYLKLKNFETAINNYNSALNIAKTINDKELQADILFDIGVAHGLQNDLNKSLNLYRQVLKMYKKLEKVLEQGEVNLEMGKILKEMGKEHFQEALRNFKIALKIMIKEKKYGNEVECRNQMGDLLILLEQPEEALNQYERALRMSKKKRYILGEITAFFGKGKAFYELKKFADAIKIFDTVLEFYQKIKYLKGEISCLAYLSNSHEKLGHNEMAEKYKNLTQEKSKKLEK